MPRKGLVISLPFGAWLVRRLPGVARPALALERMPQGLFLIWTAYAGLLMAAGVTLYRQGVWAMLLQADPTGLTLVICLLFASATVWVGARAWTLGRQREWLHHGWQQHRAVPTERTAPDDPTSAWAHRYFEAVQRRGADVSVARDLLSEATHGPHEMGWWLNGIQLKLGLLGKVIGFSVLALELGQIQNFDPSQSTQLLKSLTGGLGIALLTTMTGLAGNILLGLQLMRLDRYADALVADILAAGETLRGG